MPKALPLLTRLDAIKQGFTIDPRTASRPMAYKGPIFAPTEVRGIYTDHEDELRAALAPFAALTIPEDWNGTKHAGDSVACGIKCDTIRAARSVLGLPAPTPPAG